MPNHWESSQLGRRASPIGLVSLSVALLTHRHAVPRPHNREESINEVGSIFRVLNYGLVIVAIPSRATWLRGSMVSASVKYFAARSRLAA